MADFYDQLARFYHPIFQDWDKSIARQAKQITEIIRSEWGSGIETVLDPLNAFFRGAGERR